MGKTMSTRGNSNNNNKKKTKSKSSNNIFSEFEFDGEEEQINVEKHSQLILDRFKPCSSNQPSPPLDKYTFLQVFSKGNEEHHNKSSHGPIHIDATECSSTLDVNVVSTSLDSNSNHSASFHSSKLNSYAFQQQHQDIAGTSTSRNCQDDTPYKFPSDSQLIGITSDDEDSIKRNSASRFNCDYVDDEALSAPRILEYGFDGVESERVITFLPINILIGDKLFWNAHLTLTKNQIKLEAESSVSDCGPLSCEWTVADIVSIESLWSKEISHVGLHLHIRSKDGESAINVEDSGIVKLDWEVTYPDWPELKNKIWALDSRYKDTWITDSDVDAVNIEGVLVDKFSSHHFRDSDDFVVTFPKGDLDAVSIGWSDIQLLQPRTFINDTIIDFYMKYLGKIKCKEVPRFHLFNCFFFRKLVDLDGDLSIEHEGREAFLRVNKWTRKLDLFEKDYIFIPVNFSFHWSLVVICHPAEVANLKDDEIKKLANPEEKEMEELCKMPCILHMDSIKGSHRGLKKLFQGYLSEEWKERHNDLVVDISSRFWDVPFFTLEVPQQKNLFDCGLFLLHYAELFMEEAPENFNLFRIRKSSSNFLREHWFSPAEASSKRAHIKELIYKISVDHSCDVGASDKRSPSEFTQVDECNNIGQFINEFRTSKDTCLVNHSSCTSHQKFCAKPVVEASHILQCDRKLKLYNDERSDSRYTPDRYCHPPRKYNQLKSVMSPIEEHEESEEQKSAMSYCDKVQNATESKLLPGISVDLREVEKQDNLNMSGNRKSALLDLDVQNSDEISEISSTPSDEFEACVVEDSEETCETQDDDECQSFANHQNKAVSFDQVANSIATTSLPSEYNLNVGLAHCFVSGSEEEQPKTPGVKVDIGCPYQQGVTQSNQESNFIEITDSVERHTPPISDTKERMSTKRPRHILLEEEEPLHKRFQTIEID